MAALSIRLFAFLMLVLVSAPALAGDVSLQLDSGAGFSVRNSTGAIERLRVDEATGNVSRNGASFVHTTGTGGLFIGPGGELRVDGWGQHGHRSPRAGLQHQPGHRKHRGRVQGSLR